IHLSRHVVGGGQRRSRVFDVENFGSGEVVANVGLVGDTGATVPPWSACVGPGVGSGARAEGGIGSQVVAALAVLQGIEFERSAHLNGPGRVPSELRKRATISTDREA